MDGSRTTYSAARANLAKLMDQVVNDRGAVVITRRGAPDVALIAADELESLLETAHLLRSPANARRLLGALRDALEHPDEPMTIEQLRQDVGLANEP